MRARAAGCLTSGGGQREGCGVTYLPLLPDCGDLARVVIIKYVKMRYYIMHEPCNARRLWKVYNYERLDCLQRHSDGAHLDLRDASDILA